MKATHVVWSCSNVAPFDFRRDASDDAASGVRRQAEALLTAPLLAMFLQTCEGNRCAKKGVFFLRSNKSNDAAFNTVILI